METEKELKVKQTPQLNNHGSFGNGEQMISASPHGLLGLNDIKTEIVDIFLIQHINPTFMRNSIVLKMIYLQF